MFNIYSKTLFLRRKAERQFSYIRFIAETIQSGRIKPATYIHEFEMPYDIFEEMKDINIIDIIYLARRDKGWNGKIHDPIAFFEFKNGKVIVSFRHIYNREDFRSVADRYIILKAYGEYPFRANWVSKMNLDKNINKQHIMMEDTRGKSKLVKIMSEWFKEHNVNP